VFNQQQRKINSVMIHAAQLHRLEIRSSAFQGGELSSRNIQKLVNARVVRCISIGSRSSRSIHLVARSSSSSSQESDLTIPYRGTPIPTLLNNIPHERETRRYFYSDVSTAVAAGLAHGSLRLSVTCTIPELNTEFDVYRVGTLLELVRELATTVASDGKRVKVCVQQALGQGVFQGTPLSLSGVMRIMKQMDWGQEASEFIQLGNLGANEVESADAFILIAPQNVTGHSVLPLLSEMTQAAINTLSKNPNGFFEASFE